VGLLLLWGLRRSLQSSLRRAFVERGQEPETRSERWAWIGTGWCSLFLLGFCRMAGFSLLLAAPYLALLGLFALVYARIRAETGVPLVLSIRMACPKRCSFRSSLCRSRWSGAASGRRSFSPVWRGSPGILYPMEQAAYQMDGYKLAEEARIRRRTLFIALCVAFAVGLLAAYWVHLSAYYQIGTNLAGGGPESGSIAPRWPRQEYQQMASRLSLPPMPSYSRRMAITGGFLFAAFLTLLRQRWIGCPFHPLGFIIATAYGDRTTPGSRC